MSPERVVQLRLHGEDGYRYALDISTNLAAWQSASAKTASTTGGAALLSYDGAGADGALFFRARRITAVSNLVVHPQVSPVFTVDSIATSDGGSAELITPDLRRIVLTIPAGCVLAAQEFTMTLVTNIQDLPFTRGTFGAVRLEPEDFTLSGAASLETYFPPGLDAREVASYSANNDGSGFHLVLDRVFNDHVLIPITRFATFGSSLVTMDELDAILNPPVALSAISLARLGKHGPDDYPGCPQDAPDYNPFDTSQFPPSTYECFHDLVIRALLVRSDLRRFLRCKVEQEVILQLEIDRQRQLTGSDIDQSSLVGSLLADICPFYQSKIEPLWQEAQENCALGVVLLDFMLGFEREVQLLGATNLVTCNYTLAGNLDKVCLSAHRCVGETANCCALGHKGGEKYDEIIQILKQFRFLGYDCFPMQEDDPAVQTAFVVCLTNAWLGTFTVRQFGESQKSETVGDTTTEEKQSIELDYHGSVWESNESLPIPGIGKFLNLKILGDASVKLHDQLTTTLSVNCPTGGVAFHYSQFNTETVGVSNVFGSRETITNDVATHYGGYGVSMVIKTNQTYQLTCGSDILLTVKVKTFDLQRDTDCDGSTRTDTSRDTNETSAIFPGISVPEVRPMPNPNVISGSYQTMDTNMTPPTQTWIEWRFFRQTNASSTF